MDVSDRKARVDCFDMLMRLLDLQLLHQPIIVRHSG